MYFDHATNLASKVTLDMIGSAKPGLCPRQQHWLSDIVQRCSPRLGLPDTSQQLVRLDRRATFPLLQPGALTPSSWSVSCAVYERFLTNLTSTLQHRDRSYNNPGVPFHFTFLFSTLHLLRSHSSSLPKIFRAPMKSSPITRPNTRRQPLYPSSTSGSGRTKVGRASAL